MKNFNLCFTLFSLIIPFCLSAQTTYYVNSTRPDNAGAGTSWATAKKDLQNAIDAATAGDEIWVAGGTYLPTDAPDGTTSSGATDRNNAFHLNKDLKIYGGFAGTETALANRDWAANPTILSGDYDNNDMISGSGSSLSFANNSENTYHVFITGGLSNAALIDGFIITGGNADGGNDITFSSQTLYDDDAGGIANLASSPTLQHLVIYGNYADYSGGGLYNDFSSLPIIRNVLIVNNMVNSTSGLGGGALDNSSSPSYTNVSFYGNVANFGGGLFVTNSSASPTLKNSFFYNNTANTNNDIHLFSSGSIHVNSSHNASDGTGGGINSGTGFVDLSSATSNTIFVNVSDPNGTDNIWMTADDGLVLASGSALIGAGTATGAPTTDITGATRPNPPGIGAYDAMAVAADTTAPVFENSTPSSSSIAQLSFTLNTDIDEAGTIYYVVVPDGATAPSSSEVKAGTASGGGSAVKSGNASVSTGGFTHNFSVSGLAAATAYDVYVVAEDDEGTPNVQSSPTKVDVTTAAAITLTITGLTGDNKEYDSTTSATASGTAVLSGVIGSDDVTLGGSPTFTFASANVGTGITISTTGYTISGTDAGNYTLTQPSLSGNITATELTIVGLTGNNKVYDGTTSATASGTAVLSGIIGPDAVTLGGSPTFTFASANVGTGITISTTGYTISGTDSGNYTLTQPSLSADITANPEIAVSSSEGGSLSDGGTDAQGNETAGTSKTVTYTITNSGTTTLTLSGTASVTNLTNITGTPTVSAYTSTSLSASSSATFTVNYTPTTTGAFSFDVSIANDDSDESPFNFTVSGTAATLGEPDVTLHSIRTYPVPFSSMLTIDLGQYSNGEVQLFDILGKSLLKKTLDTSKTNIDMSTIPSGVYMLHLEVADGQKIIKVIKE